jgi:hypothetical protein
MPIGNPGGETPLIRAISAGDLIMVRLLLELGADVNLRWKGPRSWTPLMFAHDNPVILTELIAAGADLNSRTTADSIRLPSGRFALRPGGQTVLHLAALEGNAEAIRTLLRAGAEVEAKAEDGCAALDYAARLGSVTDAATALVEGGAQLTPERLEAMHASAHSTDSDLVDLRLSTATTDQHTKSCQARKNKSTQPPVDEQAKTSTECRCPKCHALIYSRKSKICGQCGAVVPAELLTTDLQVQALEDERRWARELADKFSTHPPSILHPPACSKSRLDSDGTSFQASLPEDMLRHVSCVEEFRHRDRPAFWIYLVGYAMTFSILVFIPLKLNVLPPDILLLMTIVFIILCFLAWHRASPVCPGCKQNITFCAPGYCHVCGQLLKNGRCEDCGVSSSWTSWFRPVSNGGNFRWISYCPGCGVRLDAKITRWRPGR